MEISPGIERKDRVIAMKQKAAYRWLSVIKIKPFTDMFSRFSRKATSGIILIWKDRNSICHVLSIPRLQQVHACVHLKMFIVTICGMTVLDLLNTTW